MTKPLSKPSPSESHPLTLDAKVHPCPCVKHHEPAVTRTDNHHVLPQYAGGQNTKPGEPGYTRMQALCPTAHTEVHILLDKWAVEAENIWRNNNDPNANAATLYTPPLSGHENHVIHSLALQGWRLFSEYWPELLFPRS